jgi:hypothetical protein
MAIFANAHVKTCHHARVNSLLLLSGVVGHGFSIHPKNFVRILLRIDPP